jgi:hypothetical protein
VYLGEVLVTSKLIQGSAMATILAGALSILIGALNAIEAHNYSAVESTRWVVLAVALVGLYLYLRRSSRFGWLGAVGCYLMVLGCVPYAIVYLGLVPSGVAAVGVLLISVGTVLFGVGVLRDGSLPSAGAWLLIASVPILIGAVAGTIAASGAHWLNWFFIVAELVFGSGLVVLGYGLWLHRDEPVRPGPPAQRASVR